MKQLFLGALELMAPADHANAWRDERSQTRTYATLEHWQEVARDLDRGGFDFLFFAEALAYPMNDKGRVPEAVVREAVQFPVHDAAYIASGLAATVPRLGIVLTASTTANQPYLTSRALATLDHVTSGRIGWNVVTSNMQQALVRLLGERAVDSHADRYDKAEEFLQLSLKLWEGAWSDGAQVADRAAGVFNRPDSVHWTTHHGPHYDLEGYFPIAPSPQRTPVIFQAGSSERGKAFAAQYAECAFTNENDAERALLAATEMRDLVTQYGRSPDDVRILNAMSVIAGPTGQAAQEEREALDSAPSIGALAAQFLGFSGVDLSEFPPEQRTDELETEVGKTALLRVRALGETVGEVLTKLGQTTGGMKVTGTYDEVADQMIEIAETSGVDGFLLSPNFPGPTAYRNFVDEVVPRLRARGAMPATPRTGTLRSRFRADAADVLPTTHPGASYRR